jgi:AcrR family transcriptional regulator
VSAESREYPAIPEMLALFGSPRRSERRDAAEHRERILEVARELFAAHGVDAVSMHQIALAAGVGQGTLYRRYAHKGDLCMDLMRERCQQFMEEIFAMLAAKAASPALERLDKTLTAVIALLEERGSWLGPTAAVEMRDQPCDETDASHRLALQYSPWHRWLHELFAWLLAEAVERGEMAPLDIDYTTDALLSALHPMVYRFQRQERGFSAERILQGLRHIYIEGVKTSSE